MRTSLLTIYKCCALGLYLILLLNDYAMFLCVFQLILGQVMSVERTGSSGPAGVKLTLARTSIKASGQEQAAPTTQDPEYFSTVKD